MMTRATGSRVRFSFLISRFSLFIASLFPVRLLRLNLRDLHEVVLDRFLVSRRAGLLGGVQKLLLRQGGDPGPVAGADAVPLHRFRPAIDAGDAGDGNALLAIRRLPRRGSRSLRLRLALPLLAPGLIP